jgi:hypothetical protein
LNQHDPNRHPPARGTRQRPIMGAFKEALAEVNPRIRDLVEPETDAA